MRQPFLALPYLTHLHREINLPWRFRKSAELRCTLQVEEAEKHMLTLEGSMQGVLSSSAFQDAQRINRQHLGAIRERAEATLRIELANQMVERESNLRHLHAEPFRIPPVMLNELHDAKTDPARTAAIQAIANFMRLFLRIPLQEARVNVSTRRETDRLDIAGFYRAPNTIQIFRTEDDPATTLLAVLAHEMCHHLLHHLGIPPAIGLDNERMTDAATIYFNFTPMMVPAYQTSLKWTDGQCRFRKLGYLEPRELERANWLARQLQAGERNFVSLLEPGGIRIRRDSIGSRIVLPTNPPLHGIIVGHAQDRLRFSACDLLALNESGVLPPETEFITNKVTAFLAHSPAAPARQRKPRGRSA